MINALAKLHNFCIGETDGNDHRTGAGNGGSEEGGQSSDEVGHLAVNTDIDLVGIENSIGDVGVGGGAQEGQEEGDDDVPPLLDRDAHNIEYSVPGHVELAFDNIHQSTPVPTDLIHSGEHFIDVPESFLCQHRKNMSTVELPRTKLLNLIVDGHWERPTQLEAYYRRHSKSSTK